jgi:23S rRNA pseudouridine1911/1915/1917 synthase
VKILHEDADLLVVDKPGNLVCHSASRPGQASLAAWVREHGIATPRFLNRLDRETSGIVVVTKNERAAKILGKQMLRRELEKEYVAICWGHFADDRGVIDRPIGLTKDAIVYTKRVVDEAAGKACVTGFEVERRLKEFTVVRLKPRTGRAHQLRVHLAWLGHPIVGDKVYGPDERWYLEFIKHGVTEEMLRCLLMPRHALHAAALSARHPTTQERVTWRAELPEDMKEFIEKHA